MLRNVMGHRQTVYVWRFGDNECSNCRTDYPTPGFSLSGRHSLKNELFQFLVPELLHDNCRFQDRVASFIKKQEVLGKCLENNHA